MGNSVGLRIGVLVNDFSTVNLDAAELSAAAEAAPGGIPLVELSNGCVCCAAGEDLQAAVDALLREREGALDHIFLETSGVSSPEPIIEVLGNPYLRQRVWLAAVVTMVDASAFSKDCYGAVSARQQLALADLIVLNKVDLLEGDADTVALRHAVRGLVRGEGVQIVECSRGQIALELLVDAPPRPALGEGEAMKPNHDHDHDHDHHHHDDHDHDHDHDHPCSHESCSQKSKHLELDGMGVASFSAQGLLCLAKFQAFMRERLPQAVFRIKGHVHFDAAPSRRYSLQMSGRRRFDVREEAESQAAPASQLVFIGRGVAGESGSSLVRALESCMVIEGRAEAAGAGEGVEAGDGFPLLSMAEASARSLSLQKELSADKRFVVEQSPTDSPHLALFGLHVVEWHNIDAGVLNSSLLAALNAAGWGEGEQSGRRAFLTLTAAGEAGTPVLRFDARDASSDVKALGRALHSATSGLLTAVFFSNFCCGYR